MNEVCFVFAQAQARQQRDVVIDSKYGAKRAGPKVRRQSSPIIFCTEIIRALAPRERANSRNRISEPTELPGCGKPEQNKTKQNDISPKTGIERPKELTAPDRSTDQSNQMALI